MTSRTTPSRVSTSFMGLPRVRRRIGCAFGEIAQLSQSGCVPQGRPIRSAHGRRLQRNAELAQIVPDTLEVWLQLERLAEIGDRALPVAEPQLGLGAVVPGIDVGGVVLQRLVVVGDPALVVAVEQADQAAVAPAARIFGRKTDDFSVV